MRRRIMCASPVLDDDDMFNVEDTDDTIRDAADRMSDVADDMQDIVDDIDDYPSDTITYMNNNIDGHYIAECQRCHEVFISAVVESDSSVESVQGECPCCHEKTNQDLKWIIRSVNDKEYDK